MVSRKILIFGAGGQVGLSLQQASLNNSYDLIGFPRNQVNICDARLVSALLKEYRPVAIVNAAAYTAVDRAEREPDEAFRVNCDGVGVLAHAAALASVPVFHISTDYVFDGNKRRPYVEDDAVCPINVYGRSKAEGERVLRLSCAKHVILRTSWIYSLSGANFLRTMFRIGQEKKELSIVDDQRGCPTAAADIAGVILAMIKASDRDGFENWGTYHYCGADAVTWFEFAQAIFAELKSRGSSVPRLFPVSTDDYPTPARRPSYSVLDTAKISSAFNVAPRPLAESLRECVAGVC